MQSDYQGCLAIVWLRARDRRLVTQFRKPITSEPSGRAHFHCMINRMLEDRDGNFLLELETGKVRLVVFLKHFVHPDANKLLGISMDIFPFALGH